MAEPVGDDETFTRGIERARAALGPAARRRPRPVPEPEPDLDPAEEPPDDRDTRIAELEAEVRRLRATLARIHDESRRPLEG